MAIDLKYAAITVKIIGCAMAGPGNGKSGIDFMIDNKIVAESKAIAGRNNLTKAL
jgi:hypothetical protein